MILKLVFLSPRVYAGGGNATIPWPPEPARLFAALVHAWGVSGRDPEEERVLRWLETLPPPRIHAPDLGEVVRYDSFVPPNELVNGKRELQRRTWAVGEIVGEPVVYLLWDQEPPAELCPALDRLLAKVSRIGSSRNPVVAMRIQGEAPAPNWRPAAPEEARSPQARFLRVFYPGFLDRLEVLFQSGERDLPAFYAPYLPLLPPAYRPAFAFLPGRRIALSPALPLRFWPTLVEDLRSALLRQAGEQAPEALHGHGGGSHVALVPLAFAGRPRADGHLLGVAFLLPSEADEKDRLALEEALHRLVRKEHQLPFGPWTVRLDFPRKERESLNPERWTRPARRWASVTPVVWDRYPRRRTTEEEVILLMAEHAGLPRPVAYRAGPFSPLQGVPKTRSFLVTARWSGALMTHMVLEFAEPIPGPVLLGRGRHFGMGFFAPLEEER